MPDSKNQVLERLDAHNRGGREYTRESMERDLRSLVEQLEALQVANAEWGTVAGNYSVGQQKFHDAYVQELAEKRRLQEQLEAAQRELERRTMKTREARVVELEEQYERACADRDDADISAQLSRDAVDIVSDKLRWLKEQNEAFRVANESLWQRNKRLYEQNESLLRDNETLGVLNETLKEQNEALRAFIASDFLEDEFEVWFAERKSNPAKERHE